MHLTYKMHLNKPSVKDRKLRIRVKSKIYLKYSKVKYTSHRGYTVLFELPVQKRIGTFAYLIFIFLLEMKIISLKIYAHNSFY